MNKLCSDIGTRLTNGEKFKLWYCQSRPVLVKPLIHSKDGSPKSVKIRHLFQLLTKNDIIVFGVEIFVYLQIYPTYIHQYVFVPKCDTVGKIESKVRLASIIPLLLQYVIEYPVDDYNVDLERLTSSQSPQKIRSVGTDGSYLINKLRAYLNTNSAQNMKYYKESGDVSRQSRQSTNKSQQLSRLPMRTSIALFTKAAQQYLYPHSSKNKYKHLSNGHVLLKWWLKVIDQSIDEHWIKKVIIPGGSTKGYLLPGWEEGEIFTSNSNKTLAIHTIPLLPDDPKGRFLEHLIVENRYNTISAEQFYYELGYRQEFRLGDLVGLIGCTLTTKKSGTQQRYTEKQNSPTIKDENTQQDSPTGVITLANYKQIVDAIKSTDFTVECDIQQLITATIPGISKRFGSQVDIREVIGSNKDSPNEKSLTNMLPVKRVNNLTSLVKKKKKKE
jgi:regulator of Ty1 transposition protein 109